MDKFKSAGACALYHAERFWDFDAAKDRTPYDNDIRNALIAIPWGPNYFKS